MNAKAKSVVVCVVSIGVAAPLWVVLRNEPDRAKATYSQFLQQKLVNIEIRDASSQWPWMLAKTGPFFLLLGVWVIVMLRVPGRDAK